MAKSWVENGRMGIIFFEHSTGLPMMRGYYLDKSRKVKDGLFIYFDENGREGIKGEFVGGKENGYWLYWSKGFLTDSVMFEMGKDVVRTSYTFYGNGLLKSRISNDSRVKSTDILLLDEQGNSERITKWIQGTGDQTYYYPNGNVKKIEHFKNGKLMSTDFFHLDGSPFSKKETKNIEKETQTSWRNYKEGIPSFPGGDQGFRDQFQRFLRTPPTVINAIRNAIVIRITFNLNKDGHAENVRISNSPTTDLNRAVENALNSMQAWDMKGHSFFGPIQYTISISGN